MHDVTGDLWTYGDADARVITTNGFVKTNGECVMGRGCAREARDRWPWLAKWIGDALKEYGNRCFYVPVEDFALVTFPVKPAWANGKPGWACEADLDLIAESAAQLRGMATKFDWQFVVMPRPGAGNGRLSYDEVRGVIEPLLDDRFHVITFA